jgi:phospholipid/cholesterol/gamma-HCH transport system substrate-binding protein
MKRPKQTSKKASKNLNSTLAEFSAASKNVNSLLVDNKERINGTMTNLNKTSANFSKISDSLAQIKIGKTVKNLEKTLAKVDLIMADLQNGKGTMGKLLKDEALYNNFSKTTKELELLLQDVRLNPTRYVNVSLFGKKNKPYVAPVQDSIKLKK